MYCMFFHSKRIKAMTKKVFLWTAPRCVSTAFERCMMEIENSKIFHEPYSGPYHFGPERQSTRYLSQPEDESKTYDHVKSILTKEYDSADLIFSKDMAYAIENNFEILLDKELRDFQHTFLLRNPRKTIPSLYRASVNKALTGWEKFDAHEAGFQQLQDLYNFVKENHLDDKSEQLVVVDSDDLLRNPESTMKGIKNFFFFVVVVVDVVFLFCFFNSLPVSLVLSLKFKLI